MEDVLLTGVRALDNAPQIVFVQRCVNREHWAGTAKRKATLATGDTTAGGASKKSAKASTANANTSEIATAPSNAGSTTVPTATSTSATASTSVESSATVPGAFRILVPGVIGALDANFRRGMTFVITGTFPEAGGGGGESDARVANVCAMIESLGG